MYTKEINRLFIELRGLTDEVKTYYACHTIIVIIESSLILLTSATILAINYLKMLDNVITISKYSIGQCAMRLVFLFYVVHEAHETILEVISILEKVILLDFEYDVVLVLLQYVFFYVMYRQKILL